MYAYDGFITIVVALAAVMFWIMEWMASEENDPELRRSFNHGMWIVAVIAALLVSGAIVMEYHSWIAWGGVILLMSVVVVGGFYLGHQVEDRAIQNAKSCAKCGTTFYNPDSSIPLKYCSKCGAELGMDKPAECDRLLE